MVDEIFARNILWVIKDKNSVKFMKNDNGNISITDMKTCIENFWRVTKIGYQRFIFQLLYNEMFQHKTLKDFDKTFGFPTETEIKFFQQKVKNILKLKDMDSKNGFKKFFDVFGVKENVEKLINKGVQVSNERGYHKFALKFYPWTKKKGFKK